MVFVGCRGAERQREDSQVLCLGRIHYIWPGSYEYVLVRLRCSFLKANPFSVNAFPMPPSTSMPSTSVNRGAGGNSTKPAGHGHADGGTRETVESIVMAIVLALLFRGFVAEAFVIPTGSMAPTLRGEHKDLWCPQCNFRYQAGTSRDKDVAGTVCPMCFYGHRNDVAKNPNEDSVSGDRIIVNKFVYDWSEPQRWDVIVFKYPGDASQNYIKRLIGLPGETIRIQGGNIWVKKEGQNDFTIARKPAHRLESLLQLVHDTDYNASSLVNAGALSRWYEEDVTDAKPAQWEANEKGTEFTLEGKGSGTHWLRYRHLPPTSEEWQAAENNDAKGVERLNSDMGELVTDFYAYNATAGGPAGTLDKDFAEAYCHGSYWVDDLAVEATAQVKSASGTIVLDVLRGGMHHVCKIDVATGLATITRTASDGKALEFSSEDGSKKSAEIKGQTAIRGAGTYRIRLSNVDHETLLWVNGSVVAMDGPTTYAAAPAIAPFTSEEEPGDLQPARIGGEGVSVVLRKLRIYRDKYYIAQKITRSPDSSVSTDIAENSWGNDLLKPEQWNTESYLRSRIAVDFELGEDEFFPLGDNSPYSQDARSWPSSGMNRTTPPNLVRRDLLIGKAMMVYWPHTWNRPIKFWPNLGQIRRIR